jgi:hypothetical protein
MTTSGTFTFEPTVANFIDEAAERCGMDPASLQHRHLTSARRSLNLMLNQWATEDADMPYRIDQETQAVVASTGSYTLAAGSIDVLDVMWNAATETSQRPLERITRQDYLELPVKTQTGTPAQYYIDHATLNTPSIVLWPVPNAAGTLTFDRMRWNEDVTALSETVDAHRSWWEAICAGLAARMAVKYAPDRAGDLKADAKEAHHIAKFENRSRAVVVVAGRGFGRSRRRRA